MKEKRANKTIKKYFAVNIVSVDVNGKRVDFGKLRANPKFCDESGLEFGPEGVRIICSKPLPEESKIQMKMLIPDEQSLNMIRANGTIRWFKQVKGRYKKYFIIGVCFRELKADDRAKLLRLWRKYKK